MLVGEAVAAIGYRAAHGCDVVLAQIADGAPAHYLLPQVAHWPVEQVENLYLAGGTFKPGTVDVVKNKGRAAENLAHIHVLTFDCDLATFFPGMSKQAIYDLTQDEIEELIPFMVRELDEQIEAIGLQLHGIDYTGHGILGRINLSSIGNDRIDEIQAAVKRIIARINKQSGVELIDRSASDAGTRVFRLVPSLNSNKGAIVRRTKTLRQIEGSLLVDRLIAIANADAPKPPRPIFAQGTKELSAADATKIVDAVRPHWVLGQKHALSLALAGILAKSGVPEEQCAAIIAALSADDTKPWDRAATVRSSYDRVRSGQACRGFFALRDILPESVVSFLDGTLGSVRDATAGRLIIPESFEPATLASVRGETTGSNAFRWKPIPKDAIYGITRSYVDLVKDSTEAPVQFHVASFMTVLGAMIGRRISARFISEELYANVYTLLYGPSGTSRKDTAIKRATRLAHLNDRDSMTFQGELYHLARNVSSSEGLITVLKDNPNTLLYLTEFSQMISNARRKGTSTILDTLIEAWDTPGAIQNLSKLAPQTALNPYLSIITATQPGRLATMMTDEDIISGFANRWIYVPGDRSTVIANPPELDERAARELYQDIRRTINSYPDLCVLPIDPAVRSSWEAWYRDQQANQGRDEDEDAMRIRHSTLIHKLALIHAVGDGERSIKLPHIEAAIVFIEWMWSNVERHMRDWGVTKDVQIENRIRAVIERKGIVRRRALQMSCGSRKWSSRDFNMAFDAMKASGELVIDVDGNVTLAAYVEESA